MHQRSPAARKSTWRLTKWNGSRPSRSATGGLAASDRTMPPSISAQRARPAVSRSTVHHQSANGVRSRASHEPHGATLPLSSSRLRGYVDSAPRHRARHAPTSRGTRRRAPRNSRTGRTRRRPATAARPARPAGAAAASRGGRRHGALERARDLVGDLARRASAAKSVGRLADQIGLARCAGRIAPAPSMPPVLRLAAGDPEDVGEAGQRLRRGVGVGGLGVVDEQHAALAADLLHAVREAGKAAQARLRSSSTSSPSASAAAAAQAAFCALCAPRSEPMPASDARSRCARRRRAQHDRVASA